MDECRSLRVALGRYVHSTPRSSFWPMAWRATIDCRPPAARAKARACACVCVCGRARVPSLCMRVCLCVRELREQEVSEGQLAMPAT